MRPRVYGAHPTFEEHSIAEVSDTLIELISNTPLAEAMRSTTACSESARWGWWLARAFTEHCGCLVDGAKQAQTWIVMIPNNQTDISWWLLPQLLHSATP